MRWLVQPNPSDHLLVLMSGGGSAMMEVPASGWTMIGAAGLSDLNRGYTISDQPASFGMGAQRWAFGKVSVPMATADPQ